MSKKVAGLPESQKNASVYSGIGPLISPILNYIVILVAELPVPVDLALILMFAAQVGFWNFERSPSRPYGCSAFNAPRLKREFDAEPEGDIMKRRLLEDTPSCSSRRSVWVASQTSR